MSGAAAGHIACNRYQITKDRTCGRCTSSASTIEHQLTGRLGLDEDGVKGISNCCEWMLARKKCWLYPNAHFTFFGQFSDGKKFDHMVYVMSNSDITSSYLRDSFCRYLIARNSRMECKSCQNRSLCCRIMTFNIGRWICFRKTKLLRLF